VGETGAAEVVISIASNGIGGQQPRLLGEHGSDWSGEETLPMAWLVVKDSLAGSRLLVHHHAPLGGDNPGKQHHSWMEMNSTGLTGYLSAQTGRIVSKAGCCGLFMILAEQSECLARTTSPNDFPYGLHGVHQQTSHQALADFMRQ
jgi:hypothetical protein